MYILFTLKKNNFAEKNKAVPKLYFQHPQQLLSIFTDLEDENLKLIQECREEEGNLEKIRTSVREVIKYLFNTILNPIDFNPKTCRGHLIFWTSC